MAAKRRRILIAVAILAAVISCYLVITRDVDSRFVGKWRLTGFPRNDITWELGPLGNGAGYMPVQSDPFLRFTWRVQDQSLMFTSHNQDDGLERFVTSFKIACARVLGTPQIHVEQYEIVSVSPDRIELIGDSKVIEMHRIR